MCRSCSPPPKANRSACIAGMPPRGKSYGSCRAWRNICGPESRCNNWLSRRVRKSDRKLPATCKKPNTISLPACGVRGSHEDADSGSRRWANAVAGQGKGLKRRPFPWTPSPLKPKPKTRKEPPAVSLASGSSFDEKMLRCCCWIWNQALRPAAHPSIWRLLLTRGYLDACRSIIAARYACRSACRCQPDLYFVTSVRSSLCPKTSGPYVCDCFGSVMRNRAKANMRK